MESQKKTAGRPAKPQENKLTEFVNVRVTQSTFEALQRKASESGSKIQHIARQAIENAAKTD